MKKTILVLLTVMTMTFVGCSSDEISQTEEKTKQGVDAAAESVKAGVTKVAETADKTMNAAKDVAQDVADATKEAASAVSDKSQTMMSDAKSAIDNTVDKGAELAKEIDKSNQ